MSTGAMQTANANKMATTSQEWASLRKVPIVTLGLTAFAIVASLLPEPLDWLSYDRTAIAAGETWRLASGHFTHWNADHLLWDLVMFVVLGATVERVCRGSLATTLLLSSAAISATLWMFAPEVSQYRGLSGLDSALFGFVAPQLFCEAQRKQHRVAQWLLAILTAGFVGKVAWEMATGRTLFVAAAAAEFTPLPLVHVVGAVVGLFVWVASCRGREGIDQGSYQCN
jgi:rhomboid family GlyGly-CTERM serine protease